MEKKYYAAAPWSLSIKIVTILSSVLLLGLPLFLLGRVPFNASVFVATFSWGIWVCCLLTMIRGFTLTTNLLIIHRPLWDNRFSLEAGATAVRDQNMRKGFTLRVLGNGGLFSGSGYYWNKQTGIFRAFISNQHKAVWIKTPNKTLVISPDDPETFVQDFSGSVLRMY
ncbi:MAG: hypothetical protein EP349_00035 [Alphaproteobacteria bacterium]|nr:MAG: hypothetical protein EP349_00035 [Alphaproteobacteria bacterium]